MTHVDPRSHEIQPGQHLVLYDGDCGFCSGVVQTILHRDPRGIFHFAALQSPPAIEILARLGIDRVDLSTFYLVQDYRSSAPRVLARGRAALFVMSVLEKPFRFAWLLQPLPDAALNRAYDIVARNRYWLSGRREQCLVPRSEHRSRFVDVISPMTETLR